MELVKSLFRFKLVFVLFLLSSRSPEPLPVITSLPKLVPVPESLPSPSSIPLVQASFLLPLYTQILLG